ncbi:hypothetical protein V1L52_10425 [Treponema sp. HNW]|uniref:hypothetical protein n=1 Tax=Treponema sp. HNW TaxID=3116654 RepID=UPI003D0F7D66
MTKRKPAAGITIRRFFVPLFFLLLPLIVFAEAFEIGDSLKGITKKIDTAAFMGTAEDGFWPEDRVSIYKYGNGAVLVSMNYYPFGLITQKDGKNIFLLDFDGDSFLDCESEFLFVPPWVVALNSTGTKDGNTFIDFLSAKFRAFNGSSEPESSPQMLSCAEKLTAAARDVQADDRFLLYADFLYGLLYTRKEYGLAANCLALTEKTASLTAESRCTWLIQALETAYKAEDTALCKTYVQELVSTGSTFAPGLYYEYLLEDNPERREKLRKKLLSEYSEHWMIKDRFK